MESDDPESVESASEEKKSVCEIAVEDYVKYVMENKKKTNHAHLNRDTVSSVDMGATYRLGIEGT